MDVSDKNGMEGNTEQESANNASTLAQRMNAYEPIPWEKLPDLGLYMDQVITFLERHLACLYPHRGPKDLVLTRAMINNYVKQRVIPRPNRKKYDREHLAALLMVCALKQVLPIDAVTRLIGSGEDLHVVYETFCAQQRSALDRAADQLCRSDTSALQCALEAGAQRLAAEALLVRRKPEEQAETSGA